MSFSKHLVGTACAIVTMTIATGARADDAAGGAGFILFSLGQLVPAQIGLERDLASDPMSRFTLAWVDQVPFGVFTRQTDDADWVREANPLWQHRIVFSLALAWGFVGRASARRFDFIGGDLSARYRFRFRHRRGLAPYAGFGAGTDGNAYLLPELGIHFGRDGVFRPGVQLGLEGKAFFNGNPTRIQAVAAWTLW